jgi:cell division septal protein FtsQ
VRVEGAQRLTDERLTELAAIPEGSTLLRLDTEGMTKRLEADPWVASVEIKRSFPSTVLLTVKEREIAATVEVPAARSGEPAQQWFVSKDGRWLGFFAPTPPGTESATPGTNGQEAATTEGAAEGQDGERQAAEGAEGTEGGGEGAADAGAQGTNQGADANAQPGTSQTQAASEPPDEPSILVGVRVTASELGQLIPIRDVPQSLAPKIGEAVTDEGVLNALDIINTVTPEMRSLIRSISALDRVKTMLTLTNNVEVAFGTAEDIGAKEQVIMRLLAEHEGAITYINVRVAARATYRATG